MSQVSLRNRDFIRRCRLHIGRLRHEQRNFNLTSVVQDVLAQPAPAYYADFYRANVILRRALTEGGLNGGKYRKSRMWQDMYADLLELMRLYPRRSFRDLVLSLCTGGVGHPRFYMSLRCGRELLRSALRSDDSFWCC